jgi:hypothetical protein
MILGVHIVVVVWYRGEVRKRLMISVGMVVAAVSVLLAVAFWPQPKEPEYQGVKLSEWLAMQEKLPAESAEAVRAIGTNAVPFLVRWADYRVPAWKPAVWKFAAGRPVLLRTIRSSYLRPSLKYPDPTELSRLACIGFVILGEDAKVAIPKLEVIARTSTNSYTTRWAMTSLSFLGPDAVKPIANLATSDTLTVDRRVRAITAIENMGYLGTNAMPCVAALAQCAAETDGTITTPAIMSLGVLARAEPLVARSLNWTNAAPDPALRLCALRGMIDLSTNHKNGFLQNVIRSVGSDPNGA